MSDVKSLDLKRHDRSLMSSDGRRAVMQTKDNWWACFTGFVTNGSFQGTGVGSLSSWDRARDFLDGRLDPEFIKLGFYS